MSTPVQPPGLMNTCLSLARMIMSIRGCPKEVDTVLDAVLTPLKAGSRMGVLSRASYGRIPSLPDCVAGQWRAAADLCVLAGRERQLSLLLVCVLRPPQRGRGLRQLLRRLLALLQVTHPPTVVVYAKSN